MFEALNLSNSNIRRIHLWVNRFDKVFGWAVIVLTMSARRSLYSEWDSIGPGPMSYMLGVLPIELPALFGSGISYKSISKQSCCYLISAAIGTLHYKLLGYSL